MDKSFSRARSYHRRSLILCAAMVLTCAVRSLSFAGVPVPGQQAPDFTLPGLVDSKTVSLKDLQGKAVLLNIWASWCTSCRDEMEDLMSVQEQYAPRGFALVAVNIDNAPAPAVEFLKRLESRTKRKPGFIFLYDKDKTVPHEYRQRSMPTSYLIDRQGIVRKVYPGSFSKSTLDMLRSAIEEALK
jgi:cytochrome c biogenesis protein CcmG, thiol:disulfide interchange protein DsbE